MTFVEPISPKQLLELASLDALGLLDGFEAKAYTRAFHEAAVVVQDEVLRLQAEVTGDLSLLPGDEPDPKLRERVLKAVAIAIERNDAKLAPIARLGPRGAGGRNVPAPSSLFWRAASFVLAGTALIMAYFLALGSRASDELAVAALWDDTKKLEVLLNPPAKTFLLDGSHKVALHGEVPYQAALYVNESAGKVLILMKDFPKTKDRDFVLQVVKKQGGTERLHAFKGRLGFGSVRVDGISATLIASASKWQIIALDGEVLLTSA